MSDDVNNDVVSALVDNANPAAPDAPAPQRPSNMSSAEYQELKSLAADLFNPDPDIGSAALKKMARITGQEQQLATLMQPREQPEVVEEVEVQDNQGGSGDNDVALDFYTDYLNRGIENIMRAPSTEELRQVAKRLKGDKFDEAKWDSDLRRRFEGRVVTGFTHLNNSGQKIQARTLDKVLSGAQDDIIGLIRGTIGDPTGIGRHASAQAPFPGSDIPEERTRLPSLQEAANDPASALAKASDANQAAFAKRLAALRAGADGTNA